MQPTQAQKQQAAAASLLQSGQVPGVRAADAGQAAKRLLKKRKLHSEAISKSSQAIPESSMFTLLSDLDKKLDARIRRRRNEIADATQTSPEQGHPKRLRLYLHHTHANQHPAKQRALAEGRLPDTEDPPCWTFYMSGRLDGPGADAAAAAAAAAAAPTPQQLLAAAIAGGGAVPMPGAVAAAPPPAPVYRHDGPPMTKALKRVTLSFTPAAAPLVTDTASDGAAAGAGGGAAGDGGAGPAADAEAANGAAGGAAAADGNAAASGAAAAPGGAAPGSEPFTVTWDRDRRTGKHTDVLYVKHMGATPMDVTVNIELDWQPQRSKLPPALAQALGMQYDNRANILKALHAYVKRHKLVKVARGVPVLECDGALQEVFGAKEVDMVELPERLVALLLPMDPIELKYSITLDGPSASPLDHCYDIEVMLPGHPADKGLGAALDKCSRDKEVEALNTKIDASIAKINEHKRRRTMDMGFAHSPPEFMLALIASQARDLRETRPNSGVFELQRPTETFNEKWVEDAVTKLVHRRLGTSFV